MGLFNWFKKSERQEEPVPDVPLVFQRDGDLEIASCHGQHALKHLEQLRAEGRSAGFTAVLLGGDEDAKRVLENRKSAEATVEEYLRQASQVNVQNWMKAQVDEDPERFQADAGDWPEDTEGQDAGRISAHLEGRPRRPKKVVRLAKIPTARNWEAPAYMGMGGWNDCPDASVLVAFAKRWQERYGAEIVSMTFDVMEFTVANPPRTKEAALELAKEQYVFCSDIVDQGVGDVASLAAVLLGSNYWYFWWD